MQFILSQSFQSVRLYPFHSLNSMLSYGANLDRTNYIHVTYCMPLKNKKEKKWSQQSLLSAMINVLYILVSVFGLVMSIMKYEKERLNDRNKQREKWL